jgi:glycerate-2-kinase
MELNTPNTQTASSGPRVFDASELQELTAIREAYEQATVSLGQLEMQKREVAKTEKRVNERLTAIEAQEKVFLDKIVAKYGEGTFDINTGIFTPKA